MKRDLIVYKLCFTSPLHIASQRGDYAISRKFIPSDVMYAALTACLAKMGEPVPEDGDLGCCISSLFPFSCQDGRDIFFMPNPLTASLSTSTPENIKLRKKIKWLEWALFNKMLAGQDIFSLPDVGMHGEYVVTGNSFDTNFCRSEVSERVTVEDRTGRSDAVPFYMDRVSFKSGSGLFFIAEGDTRTLDKAMRLLALEGIGTDRNVGNGFFEYEKCTVTLDLPNDANHVLALSSFIPESKNQLEEMLASDQSAYELQRRGGWITTPPNQTLRKNVIYMLAAGSVMKWQATDICSFGKIVDLRPDLQEVNHPIWRCGKALFVPVKL